MKYNIYIYLTVITVLICCSGQLSAQDRQVTGKVISEEDKLPMPGVTIRLKGTQTGTVTDIDGNYSIISTSPEDILVFSFIGYKTTEIVVGTQEIINLEMQVEIKTLTELVITGYGVQEKSDVTGAVASIDTDDLSLVPYPGVAQAIQGMAAGVNVTQNTGAPGEGVSVRIRGVGSISSSNAPLFIVDGVPTQNAMNYLSTSDIESINVLKDAASAAIYGSRANNGVVIITTKKGNQNSKPQITFNSSYGIQQAARLTEMTNTAQYVEVYNEAADNDNADVTNPRLRRKYITEEMLDTLPDVNHLDELFRNANIQNYYIGVAGGEEKSSYNVSLSYFGQEGIIIGSDYERYTGKVSVGTQATPWVKLGVNMNFSQSNTKIIGSSGDGFGGNGGSVVRYALFRTPAINVYDENGNYVDLPEYPEFFGDGYNPVGLTENIDNKKKDIQVLGDFNVQLKFSDHINFSSTFGIDNNTSRRRRFNMMWGTNNRINNPNSLSVDNGYVFNWTWTNTLNFLYDFGSHNISGILGSEAVSSTNHFTSTTARDFADQNLNLVTLGGGEGQVSSSEGIADYRLLSYFARAVYSLNDKYYVTGIVRLDASSRFSSKNRWGTFPSISAGWRIDKEEFLINSETIDLLKLRVGYGANGNQNIANFAYLEKIRPGFEYPFGGIPYGGYATSELGNESVRWETSTQLDVGVDLSLLSDKYTFAIDYYRKETKDQLIPNTNPSSAGYAIPSWTNAGKILNTGIEVELGNHGAIGDHFNYSIDANFAIQKNEVLELDGTFLNGRIDNGVWATRTIQGQPIGSFYLYEMEGIFQNATDILTHAYQGSDIKPGDVMYKDQNGDNKIDALDRTYVGSAIPKFIYGLNISMNYDNFDWALFMQGAYGQKVYYQVATDIEGFYRPFNLTTRYYDERWTGEGTSNSQPRASWKAKPNNTKPSTRFLEDGSYSRIKSLQMGYSLPPETFNKIPFNRFRIYIQGNNLFTFTKYAGLDPEMTTSNNSTSEGDKAANIEWGTYPSARSYIIGVQINF